MEIYLNIYLYDWNVFNLNSMFNRTRECKYFVDLEVSKIQTYLE